MAAHWGYKERSQEADAAWLQRIVDWQQETSDPREFMESLKIDLEQDEVFVFTPKGDVVTLPAKATPIDFAYSIHTEVGHRCIGARINGRLVSLDSTLTSGDTVEIFTSKVAGAGPSSSSGIATVASERFHRWDFHPLELQLASLHRLFHPLLHAGSSRRTHSYRSASMGSR